MPKPSVAILGGGWAGLAAAVTLAEHGLQPTLYESSSQLGGRARRVMKDGLALDNGEHILLGAYHATLALMRRVGVDPGQVCHSSPLHLRVYPDFQMRAAALPAPLHLAWGLLRASGFSWQDKFAVLRMLRGLRQKQFVVAAMTVAALLDHYRQTASSCAYLWRPLCLAALNTAPDKADAQIFVNVLRDSFFGTRQDSQMFLPQVDLGRLFPDAAERYLRARGATIYLQHPAQRVLPTATGLVLSTAHHSQNYSHIICALPPYRVPAVLADCVALSVEKTALAAYIYEPIYTIYLQYARTQVLPMPMLGMRGPIGQWVFDRGLLGGMAGLLAVVISARGAHQTLEHTQLARAVAAELSEQFGITDAPQWSQVIAEKRATFSCTPGVFRPRQQTAQAGLYLAGDYTASDYPATLEAAVRSGIQCAHKILEMRS